MKEKLLNSMRTLLVAAGLCVGATSVWADTTIGADGNTTGWWTSGCNSEGYIIAPNMTRTFKLTNHSSKSNAYNNWMTVLSSTKNFWEYNNHYIRMRADFYGWTESNGNTNSSPSWLICNLQNSNVNWENSDSKSAFINNLDGATVYLTIKRLGSTVFIIENVKGISYNYNHYYAMTCGDGTQDIYAFLAVDCAQIVIDDDACTYAATESVNGTLIGLEDNTTPWWTAFSDNFVLKANESITLKVKNYSNRIFNWNNFVAFVTNDVTRNDTGNGYVEYMGLRADKWVLAANADATHNYLSACPNSAGTDIDWDAFRDKLDGATVTITVTRSGATITTQADIEPADGSTTLTESYTKSDCGDGTQDVRVFLAVEGGHLDLLPVSKEITSAGWATYCSPYALDLANAKGLTDAYIVTGGENSVLTKTSVLSGTVPANTGLLLKADAGTVTIPIVGSSSTDVSANKLEGVTASTTLEANGGYVLMNEDGKLAFYQNSNTFTLGANTAYLPATFDKNGARVFYLFADESTGINDVRSGSANGEYYNLSGQRVSQPTKGLYISNGRKVIVK